MVFEALVLVVGAGGDRLLEFSSPARGLWSLPSSAGIERDGVVSDSCLDELGSVR